MIEVNTAKRLLTEILEKGKEYNKYKEKIELIEDPKTAGLSPSEKFLKTILWLILPVFVFLFALAINGFYIDNADWWKACGIVVSLCTIPSLVYLLRYTKDKVVVKNLENKRDNVLSKYEYKKKLLKKEIKKIEEECKQKRFFNEICEIITKKFFISEEKKDLDEKRNLYIITQEYCFVCSNCCLEERIILYFRKSYYKEIYSFHKNKIADLPNILYKQALINVIAKKVKTDVLTKINQEPEKFKNYNLKIEIDSILWRLVNYSLDQFYVCTSYDEKDANVIYNKDCSCTITLTYDGEEYTHEKW